MRVVNRIAFVSSLALVGAIPTLTHAQEAFAGHDKYAQFRNLSGLPGGAFGVDQDGNPNPHGAMALSTPIAYSLRGGSYAGMLANTSYDGKLRLFTRAKKHDFGWQSNGDAAGMAGISTPIGNFTVGESIVSGSFENCYNVLYTPVQPKGKITFAAGAEGLFSAGGFIGPGFHKDADRVISAFGVATAALDHRIYVSAGWGTSRFSQGFANVSFNLGSRVRIALEHDGFGWNFGAGTELTSIKLGGSKKLRLNGFVGMVQSKYAFLATGFAF